MALTDKLDYYMNKKRISKLQLSKDIGIPYSTLFGFYVQGDENVKLSTLKKISKFFDCTIDEIVNFEFDSEKKIDTNLIERVHLVRKFEGLDHKEFAERIGLERNEFISMEIGDIEIPQNVLIRICEIYDVNDYWLFNGFGNMYNKQNLEVEDKPASEMSAKDILIYYQSFLPTLDEEKLKILKKFTDAILK